MEALTRSVQNGSRPTLSKICMFSIVVSKGSWLRSRLGARSEAAQAHARQPGVPVRLHDQSRHRTALTFPQFIWSYHVVSFLWACRRSVLYIPKPGIAESAELSMRSEPGRSMKGPSTLTTGVTEVIQSARLLRKSYVGWCRRWGARGNFARLYSTTFWDRHFTCTGGCRVARSRTAHDP